MTAELIRPRSVTVPDVTPLKGTLLQTVTVKEGLTWPEVAGVFDSYNCLSMEAAAVFPCPPNVLSAPTQAASGTATTGGTLAAGTYRAVITAINDRGETVKSNEISQVTTGSTSTVTFNWGNLTGETGYRVYVTNGAAGSQAQYVQVAANTTSYVMTAYPPAGAVAATPPTSNSAVVSVSKTWGLPSWANAFRFAVYGGINCKMNDIDADSGRLEKAFANRESVAVARAIMQTRFIAGAGGDANWAAATDLTPAGGAVDPTVGLAILEGDAATKYAGVPTIHAPRSIGLLLFRNGGAEVVGDRYFSAQGSKIASDGGYENPNNSPTNTAAPAGEKWMYASGEVVVGRSELIVRGELNRENNENTVLVERLYVAAIDCYTAAVRVKVQ